MPDTFDLIVIGAGPGGEVVASRLADSDLRIALVERELIGGECGYWACMPSKTLLRPPEVRAEAEHAPGTTTPALNWTDIAAYRDYMIRDLDDSGEVDSYEENGTRVVKGTATLCGPGEVEVGGRLHHGERIVIATGSEPAIPPISGLAETGYWTNREATTLKQVPDSAIVLGGGPVGIELAQMLHRFGASVVLVEGGERLLADEEPRVGKLVCEALSADGIDVRVGAEVESVAQRDGMRVARLAGGGEVRGQELIVATGRVPRTEGLGLENVGIEAGARGIPIDERCRAAEGIWAVGDVTGVAPFTHVAKYQGQIVIDDICGRPRRADYTAVPRVVFCDPEVAAVGLREDEAREAGIDVATSRIELADSIARPHTYETEPRGELAVVADKREHVLVGAWAVSPLASEWIHVAALAIKARVPLSVLRDTTAQFPTYTEAYLSVLTSLDA